ncbi:MAG: S41 family peptidase [Evtepia gabavorous]
MLGQDGRTLLQAHQLIEKRFVGEYDPAENLSATLETMVDSLGDRWSYYLDPEEAQRTREARSNAYVGIGVTVSQEPSDGLKIVGVTAGSPAQEAGLQVGRSSAPWTTWLIQPETREEAVEAIEGEEGTWLTLRWRPPTAPAGRWSSSGNRSMGSPPPGSCWRTRWGW